MAPEQVASAVNAIVALLEKSSLDNYSELYQLYAVRAAGHGLAALAPQMGREQAASVWSALVVLRENSTENHVLEAAAEALAASVPRMAPQQLVPAAEAFVESLQKANIQTRATEELAKILKLLDNPDRDRISAKSMEILMDLCSTSRESFMRISLAEDFDDREFRFAAEAMSNSRSLAKLLSHSNCAGGTREFLLQRFEELIFHNGQPVYLKPDAVGESAPANAPASPPPPPRRFHNLHDAAAWIQQNWPDFDLETNHSVKWRSQR